MDAARLRRYCPLDAQSTAFLSAAIRRLNLSARAYSRILKLARTIADLAASPQIALPHLSEAIRFRSLDRLTDREIK
jgi:magnesium chelatase family protein